MNWMKFADTDFNNFIFFALLGYRADFIKPLAEFDSLADHCNRNKRQIKRHQAYRFDFAGKWDDSSGENNWL